MISTSSVHSTLPYSPSPGGAVTTISQTGQTCKCGEWFQLMQTRALRPALRPLVPPTSESCTAVLCPHRPRGTNVSFQSPTMALTLSILLTAFSSRSSLFLFSTSLCSSTLTLSSSLARALRSVATISFA